jgi:dTDP-4-dehydrorhamnose reductase
LGRPHLNIEDPESIGRILQAESPRAMINVAGLVNVDAAEKDPDRAFALNCQGARFLAQAAARARIPLLHLSSDYVFDGRKTEPYVESDPTAPLNAYGRSKAAAEVAVLDEYPAALVVRTSWVFTSFGTSFVTAMMHLAQTQNVVPVVSDQFGTPTSGVELARAMLEMITLVLRDNVSRGGIFHLANSGETTWFEFAQAIFASPAYAGHPVPVVRPISRAEWGGAERPRYSTLDCEKVHRTFGIKLPPWQPALEECITQIIAARRDLSLP